MTKKASLGKRTAGVPHELSRKHHEAFQKAFHGSNESECATVILSVAILEKSLITLLDKYLLRTGHKQEDDDIFSYHGPLGSFSSCAQMAFRLGLIPWGLYENLIAINKIRNLFAHSHEPLDFDNEEVLKWCSKFTSPLMYLSFHMTETKETTRAFETLSPFKKFLTISGNASWRILCYAENVTHREHPNLHW